MSLRQRVMTGERVLGAMVFEFFTGGMAQILCNAGCEYVIYDMEHTGVSLDTLRAQVHAARGLPIAPMVRVPRGEYQFLARALDIGMQGVMVPMVESAEQARAVVEACRYPPAGRRGSAFGFSHDDYGQGDPLAKMTAANEGLLIIAQIETERGLENLDEIAATSGIDALWVGHFDLSAFLGVPGQFDHPRYVAAVKAVAEAGRRHGKGLGFLPADLATARDYADYGFNMLAVGPDQALFQAAVSDLMTGIRAL